MKYWMQTQAPNGGWVDSLGTDDLTTARNQADWRADCGETTRVVERVDTVVIKPRVSASKAEAGDMVNPATLPPRIVGAGGGWWNNRYFVTGAHKDGRAGWRCTETR